MAGNLVLVHCFIQICTVCWATPTTLSPLVTTPAWYSDHRAWHCCSAHVPCEAQRRRWEMYLCFDGLFTVFHFRCLAATTGLCCPRCTVPAVLWTASMLLLPMIVDWLSACLSIGNRSMPDSATTHLHQMRSISWCQRWLWVCLLMNFVAQCEKQPSLELTAKVVSKTTHLQTRQPHQEAKTTKR